MGGFVVRGIFIGNQEGAEEEEEGAAVTVSSSEADDILA